MSEEQKYISVGHAPEPVDRFRSGPCSCTCGCGAFYKISIETSSAFEMRCGCGIQLMAYKPYSSYFTHCDAKGVSWRVDGKGKWVCLGKAERRTKIQAIRDWFKGFFRKGDDDE